MSACSSLERLDVTLKLFAGVDHRAPATLMGEAGCNCRPAARGWKVEPLGEVPGGLAPHWLLVPVNEPLP